MTTEEFKDKVKNIVDEIKADAKPPFGYLIACAEHPTQKGDEEVNGVVMVNASYSEVYNIIRNLLQGEPNHERAIISAVMEHLQDSGAVVTIPLEAIPINPSPVKRNKDKYMD